MSDTLRPITRVHDDLAAPFDRDAEFKDAMDYRRRFQVRRHERWNRRVAMLEHIFEALKIGAAIAVVYFGALLLGAAMGR